MHCICAVRHGRLYDTRRMLKRNVRNVKLKCEVQCIVGSVSRILTFSSQGLFYEHKIRISLFPTFKIKQDVCVIVHTPWSDALLCYLLHAHIVTAITVQSFHLFVQLLVLEGIVCILGMKLMLILCLQCFSRQFTVNN